MGKELRIFLGRAGAGKDYQCNLLVEQGWEKFAFADILRIMTAKIARIDYKQLIATYNSFKKMEVFPNYTGRQLMENIGSAVRSFDEDFWVRSVLNVIAGSEVEKACISDCRYINEYVQVKKFAEENGYSFKAIFCDYRSSMYQEINHHESAWLANKLVAEGMNDLEEVKEDTIKEIAKEWERW